MEGRHGHDDSPIRDWLSLLSRQRWVVVAATVAATLGALVVSWSEQRLYEASATVLVNAQNPTVAALNLSSAPASPPDRYAATQAALARVGEVAQMTVDAAHVPGLTAAGLLGASSVSASPTADLLQFSVTNPDPAVAQSLATAYGRAFTAYRRKLDASAITAGLADVQRRLARLEALGEGGSPLARQLTTTMHQLEGIQALAASGRSAILVGPAGNASVVQPRTKRNVALGLWLGLRWAWRSRFFAMRSTLACAPTTSCASGSGSGARPYPATHERNLVRRRPHGTHGAGRRKCGGLQDSQDQSQHQPAPAWRVLDRRHEHRPGDGKSAPRSTWR